MIQRHPGRVLVSVAVLAAVFLGLGRPGRNDKSGAWMYISGLSFIAFLLCLVTLIVLGSYVALSRRRTRRINQESAQ
jgi:hypothetical protein